QTGGLWQTSRRRSADLAPILFKPTCCRSSVVEHSLGKGEVDSSILSGSTSQHPEKSGPYWDQVDFITAPDAVQRFSEELRRSQDLRENSQTRLNFGRPGTAARFLT